MRSGRAHGQRRLEDAGAAAAVLPSLFEEQLTHDQMEIDQLLETTAEHHGEALSYFHVGPAVTTGLDITSVKSVTTPRLLLPAIDLPAVDDLSYRHG